MYLVEIRREGANLGAAMTQMRTWLDHHRIEPSLFVVAFHPDREIRFHLQFQKAEDASAFDSVFSSDVLGERDIADNFAA